MGALGAGVIAFGGSFILLLVAELVFHRLTHNPSRHYRWGVLVFSLLIGFYEYLSALGTQ